jgi:hypothetical protein
LPTPRWRSRPSPSPSMSYFLEEPAWNCSPLAHSRPCVPL